MKIMGPPSADPNLVGKNLALLKPHPRFIKEMVPHLIDAAMFYAVDPVVMIAQSYKETGGGTFTGQVLPGFYNPCGLKWGLALAVGVDDGDRRFAHARFPNWQVGALAHAQHLRAYAGVYLPEDVLILSPRYTLVVSAGTPTPDVEGLSGRWAPSKTYGAEIVAIAKRLGAVV